jgi:ankyrin repeat protein
MNADGANQRPLTDGPWLDRSPSFSPEGGRIVFKPRERAQTYLDRPSIAIALSWASIHSVFPSASTESIWTSYFQRMVLAVCGVSYHDKGGRKRGDKNSGEAVQEKDAAGQLAEEARRARHALHPHRTNRDERGRVTYLRSPRSFVVVLGGSRRSPGGSRRAIQGALTYLLEALYRSRLRSAGMSNRSYLYTDHPREKPRLRDFAEWKTYPPLAHFLLVGANSTPCQSAIWKGRQKIAIRGDARQTRPLFLAFLKWLEPQLPKGFRKDADEARSMLLRADRQGTGFHLELGEIYELMGLEHDEMEEETASNAALAQALFEEVSRLVETEGTTLQDATIEEVKQLADTWNERLGLGFTGILYFHLGGELVPNVGQVAMPPLPAPKRARPPGTVRRPAEVLRESSKPARTGKASSEKPAPKAALASSPGNRWSAAKHRANLRDYHEFGKSFFHLTDSDLVSWLYLAIVRGLDDEARRLISTAADVNALSEHADGASSLQVAAEKGNLELVKLLVEHGADVNHVGKHGVALIYALRGGHLPVYEYLRPLTDRHHHQIAARRVDEARLTRDERNQAFKFRSACSRGLLATVRRFLKQGIDVNARTEPLDGQSALALASAGGHTATVKLLLDAGADPNLESYQGRTPLMRAGNTEICRMLLAAGADAKAVDDHGNTVLMWPSDAECCRILLEAGARADAVNRFGAGALRFVAWWVKRRHEPRGSRSKIDASYDRNLAEIFRLLIAAGAKLEPPREDGSTALSLLDGLSVPEAKRVLAAAPAQSTRERKARSRLPR